jgi:hypothetical protein
MVTVDEAEIELVGSTVAEGEVRRSVGLALPRSSMPGDPPQAMIARVRADNKRQARHMFSETGFLSETRFLPYYTVRGW